MSGRFSSWLLVGYLKVSSLRGGKAVIGVSERLDVRRIVACVHACAGIPTEALESGVVRELIKAATRYLAVTTRESDDDPNCWFEEEFTKAWLREVLAKARGDK